MNDSSALIWRAKQGCFGPERGLSDMYRVLQLDPEVTLMTVVI